jgi:hypothetical protein
MFLVVNVRDLNLRGQSHTCRLSNWDAHYRVGSASSYEYFPCAPMGNAISARNLKLGRVSR